MTDLTAKFARAIHDKLVSFQSSIPLPVLRLLLQTAYLATLRTEEGRYARASITFADPASPDWDPPLMIRANYPTFTPLANPLRFTVENVVKLARAVDKWSGSIVVFGKIPSQVVIWGLIDGLVQESLAVNRESDGGFPNPGVLTITMEHIGELSAQHGDVSLGGIRHNEIVRREDDVLWTPAVKDRIRPHLRPIARAIRKAIPTSGVSALSEALYYSWASSVSRLCIGLRRLGTGGAFLMTPGSAEEVKVGYPMRYQRLMESVVLNVLDREYEAHTYALVMNRDADSVPLDLVREHELALADSEDRQKALTEAVKTVTSFAAIDGLVLLDPLLMVKGFAAKIVSSKAVNRVFHGPDFVRRGPKARQLDVSLLGTRHSSMIRYCRADPKAVGIVVSQDGEVRVVMSVRGEVAMWTNVRLLNRTAFSQRQALMERRRRSIRQRLLRGGRGSLGYTDTPKRVATLIGLLSARRRT